MTTAARNATAIQARRTGLQAEFARISPRVVLASLEHLLDVVARLREWNVGFGVEGLRAPRSLYPFIDVAEAGVVGGECQRLAPVVAVEQPAEIPRSVRDVDLRSREIRLREADATRLLRDEVRGVGRDLHQAACTSHARAVGELRLLVDDAADERRVEALLLRLLPDDVLVAQRQGDLLHRLLERVQPDQQDHAEKRNQPQDEALTPAPRFCGTALCGRRAAARCGTGPEAARRGRRPVSLLASGAHPLSASQALPTA